MSIPGFIYGTESDDYAHAWIQGGSWAVGIVEGPLGGSTPPGSLNGGYAVPPRLLLGMLTKALPESGIFADEWIRFKRTGEIVFGAASTRLVSESVDGDICAAVERLAAKIRDVR